MHAVLAPNGMSRLAWMDRPTGRVIRPYEHDRPTALGGHSPITCVGNATGHYNEPSRPPRNWLRSAIRAIRG
jgi:hypothetical protein